MGKISGLVLTAGIGDIASVNSITLSLEKLYCQLSKNNKLRIYDIKETEKRPPLQYRHTEIFEEVIRSPPEYLIIIHPLVPQTFFFRTLLALTVHTKTKIVFHIFGDFLRRADSWLSLEVKLLRRNVLFLAPSQCYALFVEQFLAKDSVIKSLPFPVQREDLEVNLSSAFSKDPGSMYFLYTGRITPQKNLSAVIDFLETVQKGNHFKIVLLVAGEFEYFENQTIGISEDLGSEYFKLTARTKAIEVRFLGQRSRGSLGQLYRDSDYYISFSTHHDDDFCQSAIEALLNGTPIIVTSWGGHRDLINLFPDQSMAIKVTPVEEGLDLSWDQDLHKKLFPRHSDSKPDLEKVARYFSIPEILCRLEGELLSFHDQKFNGFSELMHEFDSTKKGRSENVLSLTKYESLYHEFWGDP